MGTTNNGFVHECDLCGKKEQSNSETPPYGWSIGDFTVSHGVMRVIWTLFCSECFPRDNKKSKDSLISWIKKMVGKNET